ncbi:MAG: GNAT family N-acetyltransferase [Firmicutes bacterium]|nr:GNAT family N-acetyltransferase [Bacillota bacterium]
MLEKEQEQIQLRPLLESDLQHMATWNQDVEIGYFFGFYEEGSSTTYQDRCRDLLGQPNHRLWAIETNKAGFIGEVELTQISWRLKEAELKICIGNPAYRGLGFGTQALQMILEVAFTKLKLNRVYLRVYQYNNRAIRCYQRCGFKKQAVLRNRERFGGRNCDIYLMYIDRKMFAEKRPLLFSDGYRQRVN